MLVNAVVGLTGEYIRFPNEHTRTDARQRWLTIHGSVNYILWPIFLYTD